MKKSLYALTGILVAGFALVLLSATGSQAGELKYVGSSTVGKFISAAAKVYQVSTFNLNTKPESSGGESCSTSGSCDIGGVARDVKAEYLEKGVHATLIGKDAIAVIVNAKNPVKSLSTDQLKGIFTGKIKNWSEVGGVDKPIAVLVVKEGSATRKVFQKVVLGGGEYAGVKVVSPDGKIPTIVSRDISSIGQISFAFISGKRKIAAVAIDGQEASVNNTKYPITRPLFLTTKGAPTGDAKAFIDWALSPEGQDVVKKKFVGAK